MVAAAWQFLYLGNRKTGYPKAAATG